MWNENIGTNYRCIIPPILSLEWEIGLKEIYLKALPKRMKYIYVCCDQIMKSSCSNSEFPVLRLIYTNQNLFINEFKKTYYFPIAQQNVEYLHIYLMDEKGEKIINENSEMKCVIHCRKIKHK